MYADVVFPSPLEQTFTYLVPEGMAGDIRVGQRVLVPFGRRRMTGFVVALKEETDLEKVRPIEDILETEPSFTPEILDLARWMSNYYLCSWGEALRACLPAGLVFQTKLVLELTGKATPEAVAELEKRSPLQANVLRTILERRLRSAGAVARRMRRQGVYQAVWALAKKGFLNVEVQLAEGKARPKTERTVRLHPDLRKEGHVHEIVAKIEKRAPKQAEILSILSEHKEPLAVRTLLSYAKATPSTLKSLHKKHWVILSKRTVSRDPYAQLEVVPPPQFELTEEQKSVLAEIRQAIDREKYTTFLLHGVTGSGKTQVYIEALKEVLARGKTAIVLVPEIALTPQMVQRFRSHFGDDIAVLHSRLSMGERFDAWRSLREGHKRIALGPRSAVLAPMQNLGLIVVDEEHEASYKQEDAVPRYHARDVAIMRARAANAIVVLGSATPSVESYFNAKIGKFRLLELTRRIDDVPMPHVELVNMTREPRPGRKMPVFSRLLKEKIEEKLQRGEQVILLQNRRGYAPTLICADCGYVEMCKNCHISLTYHVAGHRLRCHYCGYSKTAPEVCPKCGSPELTYKGRGTQRVEEELRSLFPHAKVVRMDLDTTVRKWSHDRILGAFGRHEYDILLGTQMVAKGLDFPSVTLVGVITADLGLYFPDFRAAERTFQLLTQVAGRAGRKDRQGEVVIQTFSPTNFALICASQHDFHSFFDWEIRQRRELAYPPYGRLIAIEVRGLNVDAVRKTASEIGARLRQRARRFAVLGPSPAPLSRVRRMYRWHLLTRQARHVEPSGAEMRQVVREVVHDIVPVARKQRVTVTVNVDPVNLL